MSSPAFILREALLNLDPPAVNSPSENNSEGDKWPAYIPSMPDRPDNVVVLSNTGAVKDGRIARTGEVILHPTIQIRLRALNDALGQEFGSGLQSRLMTLKRIAVTVAGVNYLLNAVKLMVPLTWMGEDKLKNRQLYSINVSVTITEA